MRSSTISPRLCIDRNREQFSIKTRANNKAVRNRQQENWEFDDIETTSMFHASMARIRFKEDRIFNVSLQRSEYSNFLRPRSEYQATISSGNARNELMNRFSSIQYYLFEIWNEIKEEKFITHRNNICPFETNNVFLWHFLLLSKTGGILEVCKLNGTPCTQSKV